MSQTGTPSNAEGNVLRAAREFKKHAIAAAAKDQGVHDPDLPDEDVSVAGAQTAVLALFRSLTDLDGPVPHEQPVIAEMQREFDAEKAEAADEKSS